MIVGAEYHAGYVRHGESDESHRTAPGCDDSGQDSGNEEQHVAHSPHIDSEIGCIIIAEHKDIERLGKKQRTHKTGQTKVANHGI